MDFDIRMFPQYQIIGSFNNWKNYIKNFNGIN
jgi:hypothetical protein